MTHITEDKSKQEKLKTICRYCEQEFEKNRRKKFKHKKDICKICAKCIFKNYLMEGRVLLSLASLQDICLKIEHKQNLEEQKERDHGLNALFR